MDAPQLQGLHVRADQAACTPDLQSVSQTTPVVPAHVWLVELEVNLVQECSAAAHDMVLPEAAADGKTTLVFLSCIWNMCGGLPVQIHVSDKRKERNC